MISPPRPPLRFLLAPLLCLALGLPAAANSEPNRAEVVIDCRASLGGYVRAYRNNNWCDSFHFPESYLGDLAFLAKNGIVLDRLRIWPGLDGERNDTYVSIANEAARSLTLPIQFSRTANPDTFKPVLLRGLRRLKRNFGKIQYIECGNEPDLAKLSPSQYYGFYRAYYQVVNALNAELKPAIKLEVGGPVLATYSDRWLREFLDLYRDDPDPAKRLDFISYHMYGSENGTHIRDRLSQIAPQRGRIEALLREHGLPDGIPSFVTETGIFPGPISTPDLGRDLLAQAAGEMTEFFYFTTGSPVNVMYNWAIRHKGNVRKDALVRDRVGMLTPYGKLLLMQSRLRETRIPATSSGLDASGSGVNVFATKDKTGVAFIVWNYRYTGTGAPYEVGVSASALPPSLAGKKLHVRRYLIDAEHSNDEDTPGAPTLSKVDDRELPATSSFSDRFSLADNALCLVELVPQGKEFEPPAAHPTLGLTPDPTTGIRVVESEDQEHARSIECILPEVSHIRGLVVTLHAGAVRRPEFAVQTSLGGDRWTEAKVGSVTGSTDGRLSVPIDEVSARFVKLSIEGSLPAEPIRIDRVEMDAFVPPALFGSAPSGEAIATAPLTDGDLTTAAGFTRTVAGQDANPGAAVSGLFEYDLGKEGIVDRLQIAFKEGGRKRYRFEIRAFDPRSGWVSLGSYTSSGTTAQLETFRFPSTRLRYLMVYGRGNDLDAGFYISEMTPLAELFTSPGH